MHRDPTLRTRNALVIPGVLLVLLCLSGIVYAQAVRGDDVECEDGRQVVFAGACRSATLLLVIPLAIGLLLMGLGVAKRSKETCHLGHGTTATTVLAILIAATVLPLLATAYLWSVEDPAQPYVITSGETEYGMVRLLGLVTVGMALALIPYAALYFATGRPPRCCREKSCFEPCFCDEVVQDAPAPPIPTIAPAPLAPNEQAEVTSTPWTGSTRVKPLPAPIPPSEPAQMTPAPMPPEPAPITWPDATVAEATPVAAMPVDETETEAEDETESRTATKRKAAPKTRKVTRKSTK